MNRFYSKRISENEMNDCLNQIYPMKFKDISTNKKDDDIIVVVVQRIDSSSNYFEKSFQEQQETKDLIEKFEKKYFFELKDSLKKLDFKNDLFCFKGVLSNEIGRFYFRNFSKIEHSIENLLFYEEVLLFKNLKEKKELKENAIEIYNYFLSENSLFQINVTLKLSNEIDKKIKIQEEDSDDCIQIDVFDEIISDLLVNVIDDVFKRFEKSDYFDQYKSIINKTPYN